MRYTLVRKGEDDEKNDQEDGEDQQRDLDPAPGPAALNFTGACIHLKLIDLPDIDRRRSNGSRRV